MRLIIDQTRLEPSFVESDEATPSNKKRLGQLLVDAQKMRLEQVAVVLRYQQEKRVPFGEAAVKLRMVGEADLATALAEQYEYPYIAKGQPGGPSRELAVAYEPFGAVAEEFRNLRAALLARWFDGAPAQRTLAVVSPARMEGRSYLCANLAAVLAQSGRRVLLIDADMRSPRLHKIFNVPNADGLSNALAGRSAGEPMVLLPLGKLAFLPAGMSPPNPQELLLRPLFGEVLQRFSAQYDCVVIDTPAAQDGADALTVASRAGGLLLLAHQHRTRIVAAQELAQQLASLKVTVLGTVLNTF